MSATTPPHVEAMIEATEEHIAAYGRPQHSFHDWLCMMGYDSRCRLRLTSWILGRPRDFGNIHIAELELMLKRLRRESKLGPRPEPALPGRSSGLMSGASLRPEESRAGRGSRQGG